MDIPVEIGLFLRSPADADFESTDILLFEKMLIDGDRTTLELITNSKPEYAGIDPYNKLIDRDSDDNLGEVVLLKKTL